MIDHLYEAADALAANGFEVFPLQRRDKAPVGGRGVLDATTDRRTIARWWSEHPQSNIGLRIPEKHLVLDIDPRNGGLTTFYELFHNHHFPQKTAIARSGSEPRRGLHVWFTAHGQFRGSIGDGIDVKSRGGYVVAPPSVHPSGLHYRWDNAYPPAPAPGFLLDLVLKPKARPATKRARANGGSSSLIEWLRDSAEGERNNRLFWAACRYVENGHDPVELLGAAIDIGLTQLEAERTIASAVRKAAE